MGGEGEFFVCTLPGRNDFMQALSTGPGRFRVEWQTWHPAWQVGCSRVSLGETKRLLSLYWRHGIPGIECEAGWTPLDLPAPSAPDPPRHVLLARIRVAGLVTDGVDRRRWAG